MPHVCNTIIHLFLWSIGTHRRIHPYLRGMCQGNGYCYKWLVSAAVATPMSLSDTVRTLLRRCYSRCLGKGAHRSYLMACNNTNRLTDDSRPPPPPPSPPPPPPPLQGKEKRKKKLKKNKLRKCVHPHKLIFLITVLICRLTVLICHLLQKFAFSWCHIK